MSAQNSTVKVDARLLTVKISYNPYNGHFFMDFYDNDDMCLISQRLTEPVALGLSKELGIKILV